MTLNFVHYTVQKTQTFLKKDSKVFYSFNRGQDIQNLPDYVKFTPRLETSLFLSELWKIPVK